MPDKKKKRFSETGLGKFLKGAGSTIIDTVGDVLPDKGVLGIVKGLIDKDDTLTAKDKETALKMLDLEFRDVQNARDNETARDVSEYSSVLSKNIHEIIALFVIIAWVVSWWIVPEIAESNIANAVMLILGYLYGRTKPQS